MSLTTSTTASGPPVLDGFDALFSSRVAIVTGKGGVGKTTAAAALGLAGAASGRRTLLVEVEARQGLSRAFGTQPWDYTEREYRPGLHGVAVDPEESMYEYLDMYYGLRRVSWVMSRTNALDFVTAAAPGLRDLLLVGKLYEVEKRRRDDGRPAYDLIVLDAPPTGRIVPFLSSPQGVTDIVRVGPIRRQAGNITEMLLDPRRTQTLVVTVLEEMPVTETIEAIDALQQAGMAVGPVVANQVLWERLTAEEAKAATNLGPDGFRRRAADAGVDLDLETAALAVEQVEVHRTRLELEERMRARLIGATGLPPLELPLLTSATFDATDLEVLADVLALAVGEPGPRAERAAGRMSWDRRGGARVAPRR